MVFIPQGDFMKTIKIKVQGYEERSKIVNGLALSGYNVRVVERDTSFSTTKDYYILIELPNDCVADDGQEE